MAKYNSLLSASSKEVEEINELIEEGPKLSSFQKLLNLKKQKENEIDCQLKNILKTKNEKEVINYIKSERKNKISSSFNNSEVIKKLEKSLENKKRISSASKIPNETQKQYLSHEVNNEESNNQSDQQINFKDLSTLPIYELEDRINSSYVEDGLTERDKHDLKMLRMGNLIN